ncbi:MAG TPA: xanthine dehydrogenase family protein molybdopterin-binding subunit [Vicinamibacterales bacterium]|nr:xanthine dehydrogenase family protein molybdopterin-binding subunit [Vicinamibacterales bacterium]
MAEAWPPQPRLLGSRVNRIDASPKTTGRARFAGDVTRPGMIYGRIFRSPHAHARVLNIDLSAARKAPGVRAVLAIASIGHKVLYAGEEVAAVAATTGQQAEDAVQLITVDWDVLPHLATVQQAMRPEAPKVFESGNTRLGATEQAGDIDEGFRPARYVVGGEYSTQVQTHACLETHGCLCEWDGDRLSAWVSTQAVHATRDALAAALHIPPANVRVITDYVGGGFGSKLGPDVQGLVCAQLARAARAPVRLMLNRKEEHLATGNRPSAFARLQAAADADGALRAFEAETWGTGGAGAGSHFVLPYLYVFPNRRRTHADVFINAGRQRPMRGSGAAQGCFITEVVMDELADALRMDPVAFRLKNLPPPGPGAMWERYFPLGAERIGWALRHPSGDTTPGPIKRGLGCAASRGDGGGNGTRARCEIHADGRVVVRSGTQDLGTGTRTLMAVVAAETLGIDVDLVRVEIGDSTQPFSGPSVRSATAASVAPAVRVTVGLARDQLFAYIAPALEATPDRLALEANRLTVGHASGPGITHVLSWRDACRLIGPQPIAADGAWEPGLSGSGTSGVQFAEVEVDIETGVTRVTRVVCVQDCGLIVDRAGAEAQCQGGIISGVSYALMEERILDRNTAQLVNPNLEFYLIAGQSDVPVMDVILVDQPERGVIGIADPPAISTAAAIANAVRNATGVTMRSLPITPDKLLGEIERARGTN